MCRFNAVIQWYRARRSLAAKATIQQIPLSANSDKIDNMCPASIKTFSFMDPAAGKEDLKAKTVQNDMVEKIIFHAVSTPSRIFNDFLEEVNGIKMDGLMPRIVLDQIFPRYLH